MQPNEKGTQKDLVLYRIETSKSDIKAAEILLAAKEFRGANNRTYYGIYHAISAVLAVYECHKKYSFSIRIVISEFLPKRSYFLPKTQTILHYPNMISSCISNFHKLSFVIRNRWIFQRFNPVDFSIAF